MSSTKRRKQERAQVGLQAPCRCGKKLYSDKKRAQWMAKQRTLRDETQWNAYKCPYMNRMWHLGHATGWEPKTREGQRERIEADSAKVAKGVIQPNIRGAQRVLAERAQRVASGG